MPGSSLGRHLESGVDPGNEVDWLSQKCRMYNTESTMVLLNVSFIVAISSLVFLVTFSEVRCVSLFLCMIFCGENIEKIVLVQN